MNICKNCTYYKPLEIEGIKDRTKRPFIYEKLGEYNFGTCEKVVLKAESMDYEEMNVESKKIMTWDGSSYMSGAYICSDFGCIVFKEKEK